jgi:hypothetical protein
VQISPAAHSVSAAHVATQASPRQTWSVPQSLSIVQTLSTSSVGVFDFSSQPEQPATKISAAAAKMRNHRAATVAFSLI